MKKALKNKKQKSFSLIGVLLIIGTLILTAGGVVVWEKKTAPPIVSPTPLLTPPGSETIPPLHKKSGKTWVQIDPIQCFWNPWEKDWLETHGRDTSKYPRGNPLIIEELEAEIIKNYYGKIGIEVFDVQSANFEEGTGVCQACHCKQGHRLYLLISNFDISKMIELGYRTVEQ